MIDKARAQKLLGSGLGPTDVATTLGCDPSYISQMLMDDDFRTAVLASRLENLTAQTARDKKIDQIEDALLEKLQEGIQWITKPRDILAAFNIVNAAKRRGAATTGAINITQNVVSINMPPTARNYFFPKTNAQGEVVQVGDRVTVTKSLQQLMAERTKAKLEDRKSTASDAQEIPNGSRPEASTGSTAGESRETAAA